MFEFHVANLEYACGASLSRVSATHWDQNEALPQFTGHHCILDKGYSTILEQLARDLDIKYGVKVRYHHVSFYM